MTINATNHTMRVGAGGVLEHVGNVITFAWDYGSIVDPVITFRLYEDDILVAQDIPGLTYTYDSTGLSGSHIYKIAAFDTSTDLETMVATGIEVIY